MNNIKNITIGKYTLESLTNGMYASSLDLFREYVQNAVDSIDQAVREKIVDKDKAKVTISIHSETKNIKIEDNGIGVSYKNAERVLLDIGNSTKNRTDNRGFRGIGRLAGLGYCEKLIFTTSYIGEKKKTIISFDAKRLRELLRMNNDRNKSIIDVLDEVTNILYEQDSESTHYFSVDLIDVNNTEGLLEKDKVIPYLVQNLPLKFKKDFKWGELITRKILHEGYNIPNYDIWLDIDGNKKELHKCYTDTFSSDRVKKYQKSIQDISIIPFRDEKLGLIAVLWYVKTDYSGTVLDELVKGIRVRQGNMLIGNRATSNQYFKEERFNGWLIGELYVVTNILLPNARRDDFENTMEYIELKKEISEWSNEITRKIRKLSYDRSVSIEKQKAIEVFEKFEDNNLYREDIFHAEYEEVSKLLDESGVVANNELFDKLKILLGQKKGTSKYAALNISVGIPLEQKKVLEKVFDILYHIYPEKKAEVIANDIISNYTRS